MAFSASSASHRLSAAVRKEHGLFRRLSPLIVPARIAHASVLADVATIIDQDNAQGPSTRGRGRVSRTRNYAPVGIAPALDITSDDIIANMPSDNGQGAIQVRNARRKRGSGPNDTATHMLGAASTPDAPVDEPADVGEDVDGVDEDGEDGGSEFDAEDEAYSTQDALHGPESWARNPYADSVHVYHRRSLNPPASLARAVDGVLKGRNIAALNSHWGDMMQSMRDRNVSLMHSSRQRDALKQAHAAGQLQDVPDKAANTNSPPILYGPNETLAHVLHGVYPSYGVIDRILGEVQDSMASWQPKSMLDFGSGPGTAIVAAIKAWPDTLFDLVVVEPSRSMTQIAEHVLADVPGGVMYRRSLEEVRRYHRGKTFDLITAHYVLSHLTTDKEREDALVILWDMLSPGGVIVLSEHGDRWGFNVVRTGRDQLLQRASAIAAFMPQLRADRALGAGNEKNDTELRGPAGNITAGDNDNDSDAFDFADEGADGRMQVEEEEDPISARRSAALSKLQVAYELQTARSSSIRTGAIAPSTSRDLAGLDDDEDEGSVTPASVASVPAPVTSTGSGQAVQGPSTRLPLPHASDVKALLKGYARNHEDALAGGRMLRAPAQPELGAAVVGPCPHAHACPMPENSWCHFSQAVGRHRKAGRSVHTRSLPARVEKFAYVILRKTDDECAKEHPPMARAGWQGTGAFSFDEASLVARESEGDSGTGTGAQISGFAAGLGGRTDGSRVLQMARRGLEPDRWWLDQRPSKERDLLHSSDLTEDEGGDEEGGKGMGRSALSTAAVLKAAAVPRGREQQAFGKPSKRAPVFRPSSDGPALYGILEREASERGERAGRDYHEEAGGGGEQEEEDMRVQRMAALEEAVEEGIRAGLPGAGQWARLVREPLKRTGHVVLDVCTPQGTFERRVASKGKLKEVVGGYRAARRCTWGGVWPNWLSRRRDSDPGPGWYQAIAARAASPALGEGYASRQLMLAPAQLIAGASRDSDGVGAPATASDRDRSLQSRPSRRARRGAAMTMATDESNLVTEEEKSRAGFSLGMAESMGVRAAERTREAGESGADAVLARLGKGRGVPRNPLEAAIASNFSDGRMRGLDASAALARDPVKAQQSRAAAAATLRRPRRE